MPASEGESPGVALVTGASRGIGLAVARALAAEGFHLGLTGRDEVRLAAHRRELAEHTEVVTISADLHDPEAPERIVETVAEHLGNVTVLVNNAGSAPSDRFENTTAEHLETTLDLHVRAPFRLIQAALPAMRGVDNATIVQLASTAGLVGFPFTSAYTTAKHGMVGLTRALAAEFGRKSPRVYAVCPGFVDTDITRKAAKGIAQRGNKSEAEALAAMAAMNRCGRLHSPEEVAAAVVQLVTEQPEGCILDLDRDAPTFV